MANAARIMWTALVEIVFPKTHLERYLERCSRIEFEQLAALRMQHDPKVFAPYRYKDQFVKDCVIELKERGNAHVSRLYGKKIAQWITKMSHEIRLLDQTAPIHIVPVPQHASKTRDKGFSHALLLAQAVQALIPPMLGVQVTQLLEKSRNIGRLHDLKARTQRFRLIRQTMRAHITKRDAACCYFFIIDDVYTTGATFKEARRSLTDCGAPPEHLYFCAIAH